MPGSYKGQRDQCLSAKKELLLERLSSDKHYSDTPTLAYGCHDPFEVKIAVCDTCSHQGLLLEVPFLGARSRYRVRCQGCYKVSGEPTRTAWTAALMWNGINLGTQHYSELPLFGLAALDPKSAHDRIRHIRDNLSLRIALSDVERQLFRARISTRKPGAAYAAKLDAYLKWAMLAHRLIKIARSTPPAG